MHASRICCCSFGSVANDYDWLSAFHSFLEKITPSIISSHSALFDLPFFWLCLFKLVALNYKSVIHTLYWGGGKIFQGGPSILEAYGPGVQMLCSPNIPLQASR